MLAGDYNELFVIQEVTYIDGDNGNQTPKYTTVYRGWAKVLNLSGREYWDAYAVKKENTLKFNCRWDEHLRDLDTTCHVIRWRRRYLDIITIDNIEHKNRLCTIKAVERDRDA